MWAGGSASDPELIAAIYDAIVDPLALRDVMTRFADVMECDAAYFKMIDQLTGEVVVGVGGGMPEGSDRDYLENYLAGDVRVPRVNQARRRLILDDRSLINPTERRRSAFHNEFLPRYGLAHLLHVNISPSPRFGTIVTCAQGRPRDEFAQAQHHIFSVYLPHFERSGSLRLRMRQLGGQAALMSAAFEGLPTAGFILDAAGRVLFANAAGRRLLVAGDGLAMSAGKLTAGHPQGAARIEQAIRQALPTTTVDGEGADATVAAIGRPSGKPHYRIEFRALPRWSGVCREDPAAMVLAFVHDPAQTEPLPETVLRDHYRLTAAEAAVAVAVASGTSLREYAERRSVSINTVRYQMKQILAKTDCRNQSDLVRLVIGGITAPRS
jgi:DNA-binding CsgD family transcriptional regulator/PAS domain-containing protein